MADPKARIVMFRLPYLRTLWKLKEAIDREIQSNITVLQDLGNGEILIELANRQDAELLTEEGFDVEEKPMLAAILHMDNTQMLVF